MGNISATSSESPQVSEAELDTVNDTEEADTENGIESDTVNNTGPGNVSNNRSFPNSTKEVKTTKTIIKHKKHVWHGVPFKKNRRLRIVNGCEKAPIWIAHGSNGWAGPENQRLDPMKFYDFPTEVGLTAARYWPKMGCNHEGMNCKLGESGGLGEPCVNCAPPVDTKFEATFNPGADFIDISLVDGWTLPFKLKFFGSCSAAAGKPVKEIDCSGLDLGHCPRDEVLSGHSYDLRAINPRTKEVAGCFSPCLRLIDQSWNKALGRPHSPADWAAKPYCCPTPPETPQQCRQGPVKNTKFVKTLHHFCPGVYGYSYDDAIGLLECSPKTHYELTFFCPSKSHPTEPPLTYSVLFSLDSLHSAGSTTSITAAFCFAFMILLTFIGFVRRSRRRAALYGSLTLGSSGEEAQGVLLETELSAPGLHRAAHDGL